MSPIVTDLDRDILDVIVEPPMGDPRSAVDQRSQIALRAGDRNLFEHIAAGIHDGDDDARQRLAERERGAHRHEGHRVHAHAPGQKVADDGDGERNDDRRRAQRPRPVGKRILSGEPSGEASGKSNQRNQHERVSRRAFAHSLSLIPAPARRSSER